MFRTSLRKTLTDARTLASKDEVGIKIRTRFQSMRAA
jgi:hypothetical protein